MKKIIISAIIIILIIVGVWYLISQTDLLKTQLVLDGNYKLISANDSAYAGELPVTIQFQEGQVAAKACNVLRANFYSLTDQNILSADLSTNDLIICGGENEAIMQIERTLQNVINGAEVSIKNQQLTLVKDNNTLVFEQF